MYIIMVLKYENEFQFKTIYEFIKYCIVIKIFNERQQIIILINI